MRRISIANLEVGEGSPCFIVAEMGLGHDGSLGFAHAFIDAVATAGADAVKFQTHVAEAEGTPAERFRVNVFPQDRTRQDYWRRTAFRPEQWKDLREHAERRGLVFLSTPFSLEAARMLEEVGVPAWKIGSGEANNLPLLKALADTGKPVLLSTGMSYLAEIDKSIAMLKHRGVPLILYQSTNRYPCPPEHLGLNLIELYQMRYGVPVGLSDHSGTIAAGIAAVTLGACSVEVHVTWHPNCFGPDVAASLTLEGLTQLVKGIRFVEMALHNPVNKDLEAAELTEVRELFTKSVVAASDLPAGTVLGLEHLAFKKPGMGIPAADYEKVLGRRLSRPVFRDELLDWDDLNG